MTRRGRIAACCECGQVGPLYGRAMCRKCYSRQAPSRDRRRTIAETVAEVEWIIGTDSTDSIARRLGYSHFKHLEKALYRADRKDLANRLRAQKESAA